MDSTDWAIFDFTQYTPQYSAIGRDWLLATGYWLLYNLST